MPADDPRPADRSGRARPVPVEGSDVLLPADTVICAIGQSTNTQFLYHDLPVRLGKWGDVDIDGKTAQTSESGIFAGGDCVTGPATVIQAVAAGRHAAEAIDSFPQKDMFRKGIRITAAVAGRSKTCPAGRLKHCRVSTVACSPHYLPEIGFSDLTRSNRLCPNRRRGRRHDAVCGADVPTAMIAPCAKRPPTTGSSMSNRLTRDLIFPLSTTIPTSCGTPTNVLPAAVASRPVRRSRVRTSSRFI